MVDFPVSSPQPAPFPWRTAALVAVAVAAVELVVLLGVAGSSLVSRSPAVATTSHSTAKPVSTPKRTTAATPAPAAAAADLPRRRVRVVVLNGNGRTGAAATLSSRIQRRGYRIGLVGNAPSHDYPRSLVMYRPGFAAEGKRLARDLGLRQVSPLDGMRPGQLHGAHTVVILGG